MDVSEGKEAQRLLHTPAGENKVHGNFNNSLAYSLIGSLGANEIHDEVICAGFLEFY